MKQNAPGGPDSSRLTRERVEETLRTLMERGRHAPPSARVVQHDWGTSTVLFEGSDSRVRRLEVRSGAALEPEVHRHHGIHWVVMEGRARMTIGERCLECIAEESHYVPAGMVHVLQNPTRAPLVVIEIDGGEDLIAAPGRDASRDPGETRVTRPYPAAPRTRSLRVLHVYKTFLPDSVGGLENAIAQIALSTRRLGIETRVLSLSRGGRPAVDKYLCAEHYRYRETLSLASNAMSLQLLRRFGRHVQWADVVHYHFPWPFADLLHLVWRVRKPSVITYHSDIVRQRRLLALYRPLMRRFLDRVDRIVATSPNYLQTSEVLQSYADKASVIPIGLDPACYPATDPRVLARWRQALGKDFFLFIGVIRYYKGLHILLDALAATPLPTVIVGSGPIEQELRERARRAGMSHVTFLGQVPEEDKVALLELAAAVVFPSHLRSEAFGVTLLEGAMFGKPLISSEIGTGTSYVNIDGVTGIVVPPGDPAALRAAMLRLAVDADLRRRMGEAARRRFEEYFTAGRMAQAYVDEYHQLLESAPSRSRIGERPPAR